MAKAKKAGSRDYDAVIAKVFADLVKKHGKKKAYEFTKGHVEQAAIELAAKGTIKPIKNIPDIKYTYDARCDFPASILDVGFWGIVGKGKAKYEFQQLKQNNLIKVDPHLKAFKPKVSVIKDRTHSAVTAVLGNDEQATMTRLRNNDLISKFLDMDSWQVQGHERTFLSCGQVEIDEVYVGTRKNEKYVIPISAKGGGTDCLSYTQALNLSLYAQEKPQFRGYTPIPLGVLRITNGDIYIVKFNAANQLSDVKILAVAIFSVK